MPDPSSLRELLTTLAELKRVPRTGWLDRGVPPAETESVADHGFQTTLIAWLIASEDPSLDADRVLKLALVHDLTEAIFGDDPPYDRADVPTGDSERKAFFSERHLRSPENAAAKRNAEDAAEERLLSLMPTLLRGMMERLWQEYAAQKTPESRFVKEVDRLEAYLQARTYAQTDPSLPLRGFTDMAIQEVHHPLLVALRDEAL